MRDLLKLRHARRALTRVTTLGKIFYFSFPYRESRILNVMHVVDRSR